VLVHGGLVATPDYEPTDDRTPYRAHRVVDPADTSRRWKCKQCGAMNDQPPIARPLERDALALDPKRPATLNPTQGPVPPTPAPNDPRHAQTKRIEP
jgi:hypothetical protein